jgi:hypothetical protein
MRVAILLAAVLYSTAALRAQPGPAPVDPAAQIAANKAAAADAVARSADPTLRGSARSTAPAVSLQFGSEDKTATAQVGGGIGVAGRWGLTVAGPLSSTPGRTTLATGEGLNSGFTAEFLLRKIFLSQRPTLTAARMTEICLAYLRPELRANPPVHCQSAQHMTEAGKRVMDAEAFRGVWMIGGSGKVGRKDFDFTDPTTFVDDSETHDGWSASVSVGRMQAGRLSALLYWVGLSYRHEVAFVGESARDICTPISGTTSSRCREIAVGAPSRRESDLLQLEGRNFIGNSVGLAPRVTFDARNSDWFVDVPIYLRQGTQPFNGGVSVGWDSIRDDFTISLFVGALGKVFQ